MVEGGLDGDEDEEQKKKTWDSTSLLYLVFWQLLRKKEESFNGSYFHCFRYNKKVSMDNGKQDRGKKYSNISLSPSEFS